VIARPGTLPTNEPQAATPPPPASACSARLRHPPARLRHPPARPNRPPARRCHPLDPAPPSRHNPPRRRRSARAAAALPRAAACPLDAAPRTARYRHSLRSWLRHPARPLERPTRPAETADSPRRNRRLTAAETQTRRRGSGDSPSWEGRLGLGEVGQR
jgi:hypothetical protein